MAFIRLDFFCIALHRGEPGSMRVALTFDDGPDPRVTPRALDLLARKGAKGTFFCVGCRVQENEALVRRIHEEGHLIANHSFHHGWWTNFHLRAGLRRELSMTQGAIQDIIDTAPRYYRSPMGLTNPHLPGALRDVGLTLVGWDVRAFDRRDEPMDVASRVMTRVRDGSIVALHDGDVDPDRAEAILTRLIDRLHEAGYSLVRLDALMRSEG